MKRSVWMLLFLLLSSVSVLAQSWESFKTNPDYLCGEGWGASLAEADNAALAALVSSISVSVSHEFVISEEEKSDNSGFNASSYVDSKIKTYTQGTLNNTKQMIISNEPDAHVFRYMHRSELGKVFEARRVKALDYVASAVKSEEVGKVDIALRYYYWGYMLLMSLQNPTKVTYTDKDGIEHLLQTWIQERMNAIFDDLRVKVTRVQGGNVDLYFTFRDKPVQNLDYTYFDGSAWSAIYSARDGRGTLEVRPGTSTENLHLKFEFEYRGESQIDKEVESVMAVVKGIPMRKSYVHVSGEPAVAEATPTFSAITDQTHQTANVASVSASHTVATPTLSSIDNAADYQKVVDRVVQAILSRSYSDVGDCFTEYGRQVYDTLITYGKARLMGNTQCSFYRCGDEVIGRSVPMSFSFRNGARKSFVEQVVFTFDSRSKRISNLSFGLGEQAEQEILQKSEWPETARTSLMNFLENYKTAYSLKRLGYLRDIFSDDAIIVTGKVVHRMERVTSGDGQSKWQNNRYVKLTRQSKSQYMTNLERSFRSKEFINIRFADNEVKRVGRGEDNVYGIQIRQDYFSNNYGDSGYLFLMVDLKDPKKPMIEVRTWQEEKDPNFGVIGVGHF